ncbi:MAG: recombinase family protein, partial [Deltaproteobacteria bacterium]|nr:recombinase family protein [Deltaproteobacteria bacterium]
MTTTDLRNRRVAVYARYSSALQSEASIEDQVRRCTAFVARAGGVVAPELVFMDLAVSGASLARPGFEHLMQKVNQRPRVVDVIVTEDLSRISRDFADAANVFKQLQYLDVPLLSVADGIDTSARHAKVTFGIKALVSDLYLDDLRDKTLRGLEGHALGGFSTGGGLYGYRSVEVSRDAKKCRCRVEVDEAKAEVVRRVFGLYLEGKSLADIARLLTEERVEPPRANTKHRLKGWVAGTIRNFLHNEAYVGRWSYKKREWRKVPG